MREVGGVPLFRTNLEFETWPLEYYHDVKGQKMCGPDATELTVREHGTFLDIFNERRGTKVPGGAEIGNSRKFQEIFAASNSLRLRGVDHKIKFSGDQINIEPTGSSPMNLLVARMKAERKVAFYLQYLPDAYSVPMVQAKSLSVTGAPYWSPGNPTQYLSGLGVVVGLKNFIERHELVHTKYSTFSFLDEPTLIYSPGINLPGLELYKEYFRSDEVEAYLTSVFYLVDELFGQQGLEEPWRRLNLKSYINDLLPAFHLHIEENIPPILVEGRNAVLERRAEWAKLSVTYDVNGIPHKIVLEMRQADATRSNEEVISVFQKGFQDFQKYIKDVGPILKRLQELEAKLSQGNEQSEVLRLLTEIRTTAGEGRKMADETFRGNRKLPAPK